VVGVSSLCFLTVASRRRLKAGFSTANYSPINVNGRLISGRKTGPQ